MQMFVLEARNADGKIIGRAEYDNAKWTKEFMAQFKDRAQTIRLLVDDVETEKWER